MILVIREKLFPSLIEIKNSKKLGYEVMHTNSYDDAIRTIEKNLSVNLIILDIDILKDQNDSVQKKILTNQIPIILSTSDTNIELDEELQNKCYGYISENIDYFSLKNLIKNTLRLFENAQETINRHKYFHQAEKISKFGYWKIDLTNNIVKVSEGSKRIYGLEEAVNYSIKNIQKFPLAAYRGMLDQALKGLLEKRKAYDVEFKIKNAKTGEIKDIQSIADYDPEKNHIIGSIYDITKQKQVEKLIKKKEEKYRNLFQGHHAAMLAIDPKTGKILDTNDAAALFYGWSKDELKNMKITDINIMNKEELLSKIKTAKLKSKNYFIFKHRIADGSIRDVEVHSGAVNIDGKINLISVIHDITDRKQVENKIYNLAYYDTLTGLPNRKLFFENLNSILHESKKNNFKVGVINIDIDYFKDINTLYGHKVGDTLLKKIAKKMEKNLSTNNSLYRLGGDEFAIICKKYSDNKNCQSVCERIDNILSVSFSIDGKEFFISASKGVAIYPNSSSNVYELFNNSHIALHKAKQKVKGKCLSFSESMSEEIKRKKYLQIELKRALKEDKLQLYFQPKFDIIKNEIIGTEALLRWKLDKEGYISPAEFIPIAEESELILDIDKWVFLKACQQIEKWMDIGIRDPKISVNISGHHFKQGNIVKTISDILNTVKIPSKNLEIEITENVFLENIEHSIKTLNLLKEIGLKISLDDFGTGYSSLSYLKNLPLDRIKIDQSFIRNISNNKQDEAIVKTIVTISHLLNMKVIAEGVETEEQLKIIKEIGCTEVQGFYFAKPMPAEKYINTFHKNTQIYSKVNYKDGKLIN